VGLLPLACWDCGLESHRGMDVCLLWVLCVCCQVEVSAIGRSLVQRITTHCGVFRCNLETSTTIRPKPNMAVQPWKKIAIKIIFCVCVCVYIYIYTHIYIYLILCYVMNIMHFTMQSTRQIFWNKICLYFFPNDSLGC